MEDARYRHDGGHERNGAGKGSSGNFFGISVGIFCELCFLALEKKNCFCFEVLLFHPFGQIVATPCGTLRHTPKGKRGMNG